MTKRVVLNLFLVYGYTYLADLIFLPSATTLLS